MIDTVLLGRFEQQFALCGLEAGESAVLLTELDSRRELVELAFTALRRMGALTSQIVLPTPLSAGPVPIRSTGASQAIAGHRPTVAALAAADFVVDCTVEGLLHAPELGSILAGGPRVLMISNEAPENFARYTHDPTLEPRVAEAKRRMEAASTMTVTSAAGTDLTVSLDGAFRAGSHGYTSTPGDIAHWPGGLVLAFPAAGSVNGTLVLAPGDINLTFKEYVRTPITLTIVDDYITDIDGEFDAELFSSYLSAFEEEDAYATSHVGWGMNADARWDYLPLYDRSQINGTEARAFGGNFLYSTGANELAGRFCDGHFDLPMRNCTVALDGVAVVEEGTLISDLA